MSLHPLPTPPRATSAVPWTDESLAELVAAIRAGADLESLGAQFGRGSQAMNARLRLLLPVQERKCPLDRVLPRLREVLEDPDHDWRQVMLLQPPPVPIVRPEYKGLAGLLDEQVVHVAVAVLGDAWADTEFAAQVHSEVTGRHLTHRVGSALTARLVVKGVDWADAEQAIDKLYATERRHPYGSWDRH